MKDDNEPRAGSSGKPREWWIAPKLYTPADPVEAEYFIAYDMPGDPARLEIHVIEKSAYDQLAKENQALRHEMRMQTTAINERDELKARLAEAERVLHEINGEWCQHIDARPGTGRKWCSTCSQWIRDGETNPAHTYFTKREGVK